MDEIKFINQQSFIAEHHQAVLQLLSKDVTVPFIARYRKDQTRSLREGQIEQISKLGTSFGSH